MVPSALYCAGTRRRVVVSRRLQVAGLRWPDSGVVDGDRDGTKYAGELTLYPWDGSSGALTIYMMVGDVGGLRCRTTILALLGVGSA